MREIKFRCWSPSTKEMYTPDAIEGGTGRIMRNSWDGADIDDDAVDDTIMQYTGLKDKNSKEIYEGDIVSLSGNMTADNSFGLLPNGWTFDEKDVYSVVWGEELGGWELDIKGCNPEESAEDAKYLNHARSLLVDGSVEVIGNIYENPELLKHE